MEYALDAAGLITDALLVWWITSSFCLKGDPAGIPIQPVTKSQKQA